VLLPGGSQSSGEVRSVERLVSFASGTGETGKHAIQGSGQFLLGLEVVFMLGVVLTWTQNGISTY
jgi:hypothetical protein